MNVSQRFKNNGLLTHEREVSKLQEEAGALVQDKHPGSSAVKVCNSFSQAFIHSSACLFIHSVTMALAVVYLLTEDDFTCVFQSYSADVSREWQRFLNLCLCQDTHLDNVEEYKKVSKQKHLDETLSPGAGGSDERLLKSLCVYFNLSISWMWRRSLSH